MRYIPSKTIGFLVALSMTAAERRNNGFSFTNHHATLGARTVCGQLSRVSLYARLLLMQCFPL
jgi:hypothetical protein